MKRYVALLRGIGPGNPNMRNDKLRGVFESLGFANVRTVISSGNVLFDVDTSDSAALEARIEQALPEQLSFTSTTIVRDLDELARLVERDPFKGFERSNTINLLVAFLKDKPQIEFEFPYHPKGKSYRLLGLYGREICSVIDLTGGKTPELMAWLEREFSKQLTTRTYQTVQRIIKSSADRAVS